MTLVSPSRRARVAFQFALGLLSATACAHSGGTSAGASGGGAAAAPAPAAGVSDNRSPGEPTPDPRVGLKAGLYDAGEAAWNVRVLSKTKPSEKFVGQTNSDLAFLGNYAIQGSYAGYQVWDISNPSAPSLKTAYFCPASQSDVSVYKNLLFVSAEAASARLDCGAQGVREAVSKERIRGIRIFDITDISNPKYITNVQTCRGSHTHSLLVDPKDPDNVYVYISGSSNIRPAAEVPGCVAESPEKNPNTALLRLEIIKVPLAHPEQAAIVNAARIFSGLQAPPSHGETPEDVAASKKAADAARARGAFTATIEGNDLVLPDQFIRPMLDSVVKARGGSGAATGADSAALRSALPGIIAKLVGGGQGNRSLVMQCHDITLYPAIGLAGGACEGYGFLIDISNPTAPVRLNAVSDTNFSYWHSATFSNDGSKLLFSDEWGGGGAPKCRATDPRQWGADAIFTIANRRQMQFQGYYKLPAPQTSLENCVAHNGSLIPIPGREVMVQAWYQGGISVFDWTDPKQAREIAFFDRGPVDPTRFSMGGSWSVYYYNGVLVSSEIARGLDIFELTPSPYLSQNELDAAKTVHLDYLNVQGQQKFVWPPSFSLARAYLDQLERSKGLASDRITAVRAELARAEQLSGQARRDALTALATQLHTDATKSSDAAKAHTFATAVGDLAKM